MPVDNYSTASKKPEAGQAIVEFALAIPIFLLMVFGMIDMARYYFTEQSVSHTLRAAGRYAVTGQLKENGEYDSNSSSSFPYKDRRASIVAAAQENNPAGLDIDATPSGYETNDTFIIMSSTNVDGPWDTASTSGTGGEFIKLQLQAEFYFVTPFLNQIYSSFSSSQAFIINGSLIMKNEDFQTNYYSDANAQGSSTNYWN